MWTKQSLNTDNMWSFSIIKNLDMLLSQKALDLDFFFSTTWTRGELSDISRMRWEGCEARMEKWEMNFNILVGSVNWGSTLEIYDLIRF
jgi:hypothetical protein